MLAQKFWDEPKLFDSFLRKNLHMYSIHCIHMYVYLKMESL